MKSIAEKNYAEQSTIKSVSRFYSQYRLGSILKNVGAYKQKGVPVAIIFQYLVSLVYTGKSMFQDMRSTAPYAKGFHKDTVYRFLNKASVNWQLLLLSIASKVTAEIESFTASTRRSAFVVDDTMFLIPYAKAVELVSQVYDHADKGGNKYKWGFRMLSLGWTDGVSFVPLAFRHLASSDKGKRRCNCDNCLDKRSRAYRIRNEAISKAPDVMIAHLKAALASGIHAGYVLFDTWFAFPKTIIKVTKLGLHVTARVKNTPKIKYLMNDEKKSAKEIFDENKKRRGRSRYLLSVSVKLYSKELDTQIPAKLVYVRNRQKRNDWIALISTDTTLTEEEVVALYGKRWDIEVFFKICKSYLKLTGEFRQLSYDAITAHTTIVMIRYMILAIEKRKQENPTSLDKLFFLSFDEISDIRFEQALLLLMFLVTDTLRDAHLGLTDGQMNQIMDNFLKKVPLNFQICLKII